MEQVIGRVLRQPNARHYPHPDLNSAHFYIRFDDDSVFPSIVQEVRKRLASESPEISLTPYRGKSGAAAITQLPKASYTVPEIYIDATKAKAPVNQVIDGILDYSTDTVNTVGAGSLERIVQPIGMQANSSDIERIPLLHTNRMRARRIMTTEIQRHYPRAAGLFPSHLPLFDAQVQITSKAAATLRRDAERFVDAYLANSCLQIDDEMTYVVGPIVSSSDTYTSFANAVHQGYSGLNALELDFAHALDRTGLAWARNPTTSGFHIPLLTKGKGPRNYCPDFLVWHGDEIFILDTKGDHLIVEAAGIKLLDIQGSSSARRVRLRLITQGQWDRDPIRSRGGHGYTVWSLRNGLAHPVYCPLGVTEAAERALEA